MKFLSKLFSRRILLALQLIITAFFGYVIYKLNMLPIKFFIPLMVIVVLVFLGLYIGQKKPEDRPIKTAIYKIISLLVSIAMIFGSLKVMQGSNVLDLITGANSQVIQMSVIVLKDNNVNNIKDLKDSIFGACSASDEINTNKAKTLIEDEINTIILEDYVTLADTVKALYNGEIDAMILKEMERDSIGESYEGFDDRTKVIKTYEIKIASATANSAQVTQEPFNIFICGTDQKGDISTAGLSDVNMICTVNPVTKQLYLTSIPRDYYVDIAGYNGKDKLTHSAKGGIQCTMETIENFMGIEFNYYVKMNFTSFMSIIDALGGIEIDIPVYDTLYSDDGSFTTKIYKYEMKPGKTTMNSKQALAFVRERKSFVDGDKVRGQNQQLMIKAVVKKICSPSIITKLDGIFESVAESLETNMSSDEIRSLINMQMSDMAAWDVVSYHLDGESIRVKEFATIPGGTSNPNGLFVMQPYQETIDKAKSNIDTVMANEILIMDEDDE